MAVVFNLEERCGSYSTKFLSCDILIRVDSPLMAAHEGENIMVWESFFTSLGTTVIKKLFSLAQKRDEERLRVIIRDELEKYARSLPSSSAPIVNVTNIDMLVQQVILLAKTHELMMPGHIALPSALSHSNSFNLMQKATGQYLDGADGKVYPSQPNGGEYQYWKAIELSPNVIQMRHFQSGKLLDAAPDQGVYLLDDNGGPYQKWKIERVGDQGFLRLRQLATGLLLDAGGGRAYILEDNGGDYQLWKIVSWWS
jgi:Ricin-type beta-trefoil lectin domain-like